MKLLKIIGFILFFIVGFYLGVNNFDYIPPKAVPVSAPISKVNIARDTANVNEKGKMQEKKNTIAEVKKESVQEKELILYLKIFNLQGPGYTNELTQKRQIEQRMMDEPMDFFESAKDILVQEKINGLQNNEVLLQLVLNLKVDEINKVFLLKEISEKPLTRKKDGSPSDQCFLSKMAIEKMLAMGRVNEASDILKEQQQGSFGSDEELVTSFIAKPFRKLARNN